VVTEDLHTKVELLTRDMQYVKEELSEIKALLKGFDEKKANKWVEDAATWLLYIIVGTVLAAVLGLVLIKNS
jgi:hypothetical protein